MKESERFARRESGFAYRLGKWVGPFSLGRWLQLFVVVLVGSVILSYMRPEKTNRSYLQELINTGSVEKGVFNYVAAMKKATTDSSISETDWTKIEKGLSQCVVKEAKIYVSTVDTYLEAPANKDTPMVFLKRFLKVCGATE